MLLTRKSLDGNSKAMLYLKKVDTIQIILPTKVKVIVSRRMVIWRRFKTKNQNSIKITTPLLLLRMRTLNDT